jgi:hypothetical protein
MRTPCQSLPQLHAHRVAFGLQSSSDMPLRALVLVACLAQLAGCVLPPPKHRVALAVDGAAVAAGLGLILKDAWDCRGAGGDGCHLHSYDIEGTAGAALLFGGVVLAVLTLAIAERATPPAPPPSRANSRAAGARRSDAAIADPAR